MVWDALWSTARSVTAPHKSGVSSIATSARTGLPQSGEPTSLLMAIDTCRIVSLSA